MIDPHPPNLSLAQPKYTSLIPIIDNAVAHIIQGSHVTYRSHPANFSATCDWSSPNLTLPKQDIDCFHLSMSGSIPGGIRPVATRGNNLVILHNHTPYRDLKVVQRELGLVERELHKRRCRHRSDWGGGSPSAQAPSRASARRRRTARGWEGVGFRRWRAAI